MCILKDFSPCFRKCSLGATFFYFILIPFAIWLINDLTGGYMHAGVSIYMSVFSLTKYALGSMYKSLHGPVRDTKACQTGLLHSYYVKYNTEGNLSDMVNATECKELYNGHS